MEIKITKTDNDKLSMTFDGEFSWPDTCLMLTSALAHSAKTTIKEVSSHFDVDPEEVAADVADMINFAISNILDDIAPPSPDLQITEIAIATIENQIIQEAAQKHISIEEALNEYQERLKKSPYAPKETTVAAYLRLQEEERNMGCKKGKGKGGK